jgi:hypothetical protein
MPITEAPPAPAMLQTLPVAAYRFHARCEKGGWLPPWPGSALRGAFGHALRQLACMTGEPECQGCLLRSSCLYSSVFESPRVPTNVPGNGREGPNPYVIQGRYQEQGQKIRKGDAWSFTMVLMGPALQQLPLLIVSWQRALSRGITPRELCFTLEKVECLDQLQGRPQPVWQAGQNTPVKDHTPGIALPPAPVVPELMIELITPARILRRRELQNVENFAIENWLAALMRRYAAVSDCHFQERTTPWPLARLHELADTLVCQADLHWATWQRYSSRQGQKMDLSGVMGTLRLTGDWSSVWPLLYFGQWLHVGKNATFGLGGYRLLLPQR